VIWFENDRILYGGCLVKSFEATNLGYIGEANLDEWPITINNVKKRFTRPNFVITGHQDWTNTKSLNHTLKLIRKEKNRIKTTANHKK
jgi:metallo-beta-lactamase class B